jgi:hypothetical protein
MTNPGKIPEAARLIMSPDTTKRLVELYRQAKQTDDQKIMSAAEDAMKHFIDAEAALARFLAAEGTVNEFISKA